ncbi:MAG: alanine/ornithine racemase family PLP-dependent enzyme [Pseudomonadota bacterium]
MQATAVPPSPSLSIDLDAIEHNARIITDLCREHGIEVTGVTKATCGHPEVAGAMLRGGVSSIADSRMENIRRLQAAGINAPCMLLRVPALSIADEVVGSVAVSLNSELSVLEALARATKHYGRVHEVILMVDLGDLREGILPADLIPFVRETLKLPGIKIKGLGTNLACFGGVAPDRDNMSHLVELACELEQTFGLTLAWISGANSSGLELIAAGNMPHRINHARIGEAILLGRETLQRRPVAHTRQDAFILHAEILELKTKPSKVMGKRCEDAFGRKPLFKDHGLMDRALLNVGREDVDIEGIMVLDPRLKIIGASSGYLVVDVTEVSNHLRVGDTLSFSLNYSGLLAAMTSEYVKKRPLRGGVHLETIP